MTVATLHRSDALIIRVVGDLVGDTRKEWDPLVAALPPGIRRVVVDMADADFMDGAGLRALLHARHACVSLGVTFTVQNPGMSARYLMELTGTTDLLLPTDLPEDPAESQRPTEREAGTGRDARCPAPSGRPLALTSVNTWAGQRTDIEQDLRCGVVLDVTNQSTDYCPIRTQPHTVARRAVGLDRRQRRSTDPDLGADRDVTRRVAGFDRRQLAGLVFLGGEDPDVARRAADFDRRQPRRWCRTSPARSGRREGRRL
ncbi:STAS domain-containing protein [Actinoplanes oblitus]|uniref:STAS domain-containing protein n=1 Tax=Actinoplanes oblitus TaxID=3040509 RepID=A0ABY8WQY3_9ACTN|nr:STAS domain-containing protein [Actinoplanes oblitus]WIN00059.1 STAS domain-containing protein [Actinoplanes oblitus]